MGTLKYVPAFWCVQIEGTHNLAGIVNAQGLRGQSSCVWVIDGCENAAGIKKAVPGSIRQDVAAHNLAEIVNA